MDSELTKSRKYLWKKVMEVRMDELLQRALKRREHLRRELEAIEHFIQSYAPLKEQERSLSTTADLFERLPTPKHSKALKAKEVAAAMRAAEQIILRAGRPLSRSILLRELEKAGHPVVGTDKSKVLGTNLWRSKRFRNMKGLGYWPRSTPLPEEFNSVSARPSILLDDDD